MKRKLKLKKKLFSYINYRNKNYFSKSYLKKTSKKNYNVFFKLFLNINSLLKKKNLLNYKYSNKNYNKLNFLPIYKFHKSFFYKNKILLNLLNSMNYKNYFFKNYFILTSNNNKNLLKDILININLNKNLEKNEKNDFYIESKNILIFKIIKENTILNNMIIFLLFTKELYKLLILLSIKINNIN